MPANCNWSFALCCGFASRETICNGFNLVSAISRHSWSFTTAHMMSQFSVAYNRFFFKSRLIALRCSLFWWSQKWKYVKLQDDIWVFILGHNVMSQCLNSLMSSHLAELCEIKMRNYLDFKQIGAFWLKITYSNSNMANACWLL